MHELDRASRARSRALRAARVVSIAATMMLGPAACSQSHVTVGADAGRTREDAGWLADAGPLRRDAGPVRRDGGPRDAGLLGRDAGHDGGAPDAGLDCPDILVGPSCCAPMPEWCCLTGGWNEVDDCCYVCAEGPMVPPSAPV